MRLDNQRAYGFDGAVQAAAKAAGAFQAILGDVSVRWSVEQKDVSPYIYIYLYVYIQYVYI